MHKIFYAPRFPFHKAFDMCHPNYDLNDNEFQTLKSPIAGYFSSTSQITESAYDVPLKHGIPIDYDKQRNKDGHTVCLKLCEREWEKKEVDLFSKLVNQNYGYRMYVDDLPSATKYEGQDHYDENIPLGYFPKQTKHELAAE